MEPKGGLPKQVFPIPGGTGFREETSSTMRKLMINHASCPQLEVGGQQGAAEKQTAEY